MRNLLKSARVSPNVQAYAYIFGEFDYNATPAVPLGTRILAHSNTNVRALWAPNGEKGCYVGHSIHHYRCIKCYFPHTQTCRDIDTAIFIPNVVPFSEVKTDDYLRSGFRHTIHPDQFIFNNKD